jgi:hypothetical protein
VAAHTLTAEQRLLCWGPWWSLGALGTLAGLALLVLTAHLTQQEERQHLEVGLWILGLVVITAGWACAGLAHNYRRQHDGSGLDGRNAVAQLWLLGHATLVTLVGEACVAQGYKPIADTLPAGAVSQRYDLVLARADKQYRLRILRRPGAVSLWTVDEQWMETQRDGLDGLILVTLGTFSPSAEDFGRRRALTLVDGTRLLSLVSQHPRWQAMDQAKQRLRKLDGGALSPTLRTLEEEADATLACLGWVLGTQAVTQDLMDGVKLAARGLGPGSELETALRLLRLALCQACHDPSGRGVAWAQALMGQHDTTVADALWEGRWLAEWLEEDPPQALWEALLPYWPHLVARFPLFAGDEQDRPAMEAPLVVLAKLWVLGKGQLVLDTHAKGKIQRYHAQAGPLHGQPAAAMLVSEFLGAG